MKQSLLLQPKAEDDIQSSLEFYEHAREGLGRKFVLRVNEVFGQIEMMPLQFAIVWRDVRAVTLRQFKHVVYYVVFADRVEILAVLHGSREPSEWQSRE